MPLIAPVPPGFQQDPAPAEPDPAAKRRYVRIGAAGDDGAPVDPDPEGRSHRGQRDGGAVGQVLARTRRRVEARQDLCLGIPPAALERLGDGRDPRLRRDESLRP